METLVSLMLGAVVVLAGAVVWTRSLGFPAQRLAEYAGKDPAFSLRDHLNGPILCEGVVFGPTGRAASRFVADIHGSWQGNVGTLTETFRYDSGAVQERCWTLTLGNDGSIRAEAPDVIGTGTGMASGPAVRMRYRIRLPEDSGGHVLDAVDWMYVVDNGTVINRSQFRKFGIKVAELVATMRRVEPA